MSLLLVLSLSLLAALTAARQVDVSELRTMLPSGDARLSRPITMLADDDASYNETTARALVYLAGTAYCDQDAIMAW